MPQCEGVHIRTEQRNHQYAPLADGLAVCEGGRADLPVLSRPRTGSLSRSFPSLSSRLRSSRGSLLEADGFGAASAASAGRDFFTAAVCSPASIFTPALSPRVSTPARSPRVSGECARLTALAGADEGAAAGGSAALPRVGGAALHPHANQTQQYDNST